MTAVTVGPGVDHARTTHTQRPPTSSQAPPPHRRLDVQGLRALAVTVVVAFHAGLPIPGGFLGVDIFFVISGYVIIALLFREIEERDRISYSRFFTRRARRILPALSLVTTLTVVGAWFWLSPLGTQQETATTAMGAELSVANWVIRALTGDYFADAAGLNPLLHTWSLSVEEQFYLVFPALMVITWVFAYRHRRNRRTAVIAMLVALGVVSFIGAWWLTGPAAEQSTTASGWAFYGSYFRVWEFAIGGLLAIGVRYRPHLPTRVLEVAAGLGIVAVLVSLFIISSTTPSPGPTTLLPVLGTALVIYAGTGTEEGVVPGLASRPMVWLGDLSYSWYLWHWPAIVFTSVLTFGSGAWMFIAAFGSLVPAWISYRMLEQPIRNSQIQGRQVVAMAAVCMLIPLSAAVMLKIHANHAVSIAEATTSGQVPRKIGVEPTPSATPQDLGQAAVLAQRGQWEVYHEPCLGHEAGELGSCTFFDGTGKPRAVIVGDSHAGAQSPGFLEATKRLGYSAEVITSPGCPFTAAELSHNGALDHGCANRNANIRKYLKRTDPAIVVIANRSPRFVNPTIPLADELEPGGDPECVADPATDECYSHSDAVSVWASSLAGTIKQLQSQGTQVALIATVPENERGLSQCMRGSDVNLDCLETPRDVTWDRRVDVISAEKRVARHHNAVVFDPFNQFCDDTTCHQYINNEFMYRNDDHINYLASEWLAGHVTKLLRSASQEPV